ncbi:MULTISPECIES: hypothetical protein [Cytobacillus]|uniref:hypothetical protein n=1 Tax=Cytobacillus TaxID=2675230 RepID=UPI0002EA6D08|nr:MULTISPECIES: hypothetical protein [Cytobacillus]MCS0824092.1 hypothetical protein [Cytobacillus firmus]
MSPNIAHLQTDEEEIPGSESEEGSSSDRGRRNQWEREIHRTGRTTKQPSE